MDPPIRPPSAILLSPRAQSPFFAPRFLRHSSILFLALSHPRGSPPLALCQYCVSHCNNVTSVTGANLLHPRETANSITPSCRQDTRAFVARFESRK